ncbi:MAG: hypothetical protein KUL86_10295 [Castellaniella sp.]|nr:hypothetical protein [Castellaniella sp.]
MSKQLEQEVRSLAARLDEQLEEVGAALAGVAALLARGDTYNAGMLLHLATERQSDTVNLQALRRVAGGGDD